MTEIGVHGLVGQVVVVATEQLRLVGQVVVILVPCGEHRIGLIDNTAQTVGNGGEVARIVHKCTHVGGNRGDSRLVGQVVVVAAEKFRLVRQVVVIARVGHRGESVEIHTPAVVRDQVVAVTARIVHEQTAVVRLDDASSQRGAAIVYRFRALFVNIQGRARRHVVGERNRHHTAGHKRVVAETHHDVGITDSVVDLQPHNAMAEMRVLGFVENHCRAFRGVPVGVHLCGDGVHRDVARIVDEGAHIRGHCRDFRNVVLGDIPRVVRQIPDILRNRRLVGQVVVVAAEAVARLLRVEGIGHAHQLLRTGNRVVGAAGGVGLGLQEEGAVRPVDAGKAALLHRAAADFHGQQAVGVGGGGVRLHIHGVATGAPLQDAHAHTHRRVGDQRVARVANHRLVAEFLRCLRKKRECAEHGDNESCKYFFHTPIILMN